MAKKASQKPTGDSSPVVTVRVLCNSLGEGGFTYSKGDEFETTEARAAALGDSVELVKS
jgi:hypothetical protein